MVRAAFALLASWRLLGVVAYVVLWALLPREGERTEPVRTLLPVTRSWSATQLVGGVAAASVVLGLVASNAGPGPFLVLGLIALAVSALGLLAAPWLMRARHALALAREAKLVSDARADMAAHLHDSVLQTLALILGGLGILDPTRNEPEKYVNFYAFLQKHVDAQIGAVLDALDANPGLADKTVIVRIADHGELGLSHGGLRQKMFNVYEEMFNVPLIVSNPTLFPNPVQTDALASLIDIMPTLAALADVPDPGAWTFRGVNLMPVILDASQNPTNPTVKVQDSILFTFDDENVGTHLSLIHI